MYAAFPLDMKKNREYEECSLGVCGFGQCGLDHISHLPSFTDMSRHGDARCEEFPLRVMRVILCTIQWK